MPVAYTEDNVEGRRSRERQTMMWFAGVQVRRTMRNWLKMTLTVIWVALGCVGSGVTEPGLSWRDPQYRTGLKNEALAAEFQSGLLVRLTDRQSGRVLLSIEPAQLPADLPLFGDRRVDLDNFEVQIHASKDSVLSKFTAPDGMQWNIRWTIEPGSGDLIANSRTST